MSLGIDEKLEQIMGSLTRIEKALNIVPDREATINDYDSSIGEYEKFAIEELKLEQITINNHKSVIRNFLNHFKGKINKQTPKAYLESNDSSRLSSSLMLIPLFAIILFLGTVPSLSLWQALQ